MASHECSRAQVRVGQMSQADFKELWSILDWRGWEWNDAGTAAIHYHKAIKAGAQAMRS